MEQMEKYYRVYAAFKEGLDKIDSHRYMVAAQNLADKGDDSHIGKVYYRVVDLDWVEAIESTLVYIDKAIREQRRFIEVTEEVVPIEKARNITTESVRHLAQHTNLIARVEGTDVTPERILNIQREESFAIYENRFLYTLLQKLAYFVGLRYKALSDAPNDSFSKVNIHRDFQVFDEKVEYDLSFSIESHTNTKVDLNADVSTLSGYERVLRIRTVLGDFLSTPLMRELTGCEPVRPPILHTNLMTKNPNFKKSLDLWNYIETYTKPGYQAAGNEFDGVLGESYKNAIYDTIVLQQFAIELCSNPDLEEQLREELEEQKAIEEAERKAAEEEKFKLYEQKAELAVLEERNALREQLEGMEKSLNSLKKEIADLTVDQENKERKIQRLTSEVKHLEKEVSDRDTRILNMQLELDRKTSELEAAKEEAEKFKAKFKESEEKVAELEAKLPALEEKIATLETELAAAGATIAALTAELGEKKAELEAKAAEIVELNTKIATLEADIESKAGEIAMLNSKIASLEENIASLNNTIIEKNSVIEQKDSELASKSEQISALESDNAGKQATIDSLNSELESKKAVIEENNRKIEANENELNLRSEKILSLEADIVSKNNDIAQRESVIVENNKTIAAKEENINSLKNDIDRLEASHSAELEKNRADALKIKEEAVEAARKEEAAKYKKKIAEINASARNTIAASVAAAESSAKAKALSVKYSKEFDNGLSIDEFRALVRRACSIKKSENTGAAGVVVDSFNADCSALAEKYGISVLELKANNSKFEKSAKPIEALELIAPMLEAGEDIYFFASNEKKTGAIASLELAARETDSLIESFDCEALTGSAIANAVGTKKFYELGADKSEMASKKLNAITYADKSVLGIPVKGKLKKVAKTDEVNLPLALDYILTGSDKRFAFVLYNGMSEEEISDLRKTLEAEIGFEEVIAEPSADVKIKALANKSATVYYYI